MPQSGSPELFAMHRAAAAKGLLLRGGVHRDSVPLIQTGGTIKSTGTVCREVGSCGRCALPSNQAAANCVAARPPVHSSRSRGSYLPLTCVLDVSEEVHLEGNVDSTKAKKTCVFVSCPSDAGHNRHVTNAVIRLTTSTEQAASPSWSVNSLPFAEASAGLKCS